MHDDPHRGPTIRAAQGARSRAYATLKFADRSALVAFLARHGLEPERRLGQHFLARPSVVERIVERLDGVAGVLEIGPGPGILTGPLCERCEQVVAIELDPRAVAALAESAPQARIVSGDALRIDWKPLLAELPVPSAIVSNMPYNITGPLLERVQSARPGIAMAVLMMQREVARRITAEPGDRELGALGVVLRTLFDARLVAQVPAAAFEPPPKVASSVLEFASLPTPDLDEARFARFVHLAFKQPRKTLSSNLRAGYGLDAVRAATLLAQAGVSTNVRPHQVGLAVWRKLDDIFADIGPS